MSGAKTLRYLESGIILVLAIYILGASTLPCLSTVSTNVYRCEVTLRCYCVEPANIYNTGCCRYLDSQYFARPMCAHHNTRWCICVNAHVLYCV